jgi:hypothetical protein
LCRGKNKILAQKSLTKFPADQQLKAENALLRFQLFFLPRVSCWVVAIGPQRAWVRAMFEAMVCWRDEVNILAWLIMF